MSSGKVDAGSGLNWLTEAVGLVFRNAAAFLVMALIVGAINLVPFLGGLALTICGPALLGGVAFAAREESEGRKAEIPHLFRAFQDPGKIGPMLVLCLPAVAGGALLLVCALVFGVGALIGGGLSAANGSSLGVGTVGGGLMLLCLIALVVVFLINALQFFAVPRVMFDGVEPFAAMKESLSTCLANIGAILVFAVVFVIAFCVLMLVLVWIPILGWVAIGGGGMVVLGAAQYFAWRQVYRGAADVVPPAAPVPEMPPPAP
jgi:hypothetical protein